jgi:hypothetical protein
MGESDAERRVREEEQRRQEAETRRLLEEYRQHLGANRRRG